MHPQQRRIQEILRQANDLGKLTVLGGPSVSITPEFYPQADLLHVGELGDGPVRLLDFLRTASGKPARQMVFETGEKMPLDEQPLPASSGRCQSLPDYAPAIFRRLPLSLRILRYPDHLWAPAAGKVGCPRDPGTPGHLRHRVRRHLVVCGRQLDRRSPGLARTAAGAGPLATGAPISVSLVRRGVPRSGQRSGKSARASRRPLHALVRRCRVAGRSTLHAIAKTHNTRQPILEAIRNIQAHGIEVMLG